MAKIAPGMTHDAPPPSSDPVRKQQLEEELHGLKRRRGALGGGLFVTLVWLVVVEAALPRLAERYGLDAGFWTVVLVALGGVIAAVLLVLLVPTFVRANRVERALQRHLGEEAMLERLREHRDGARWYLVVGVAMMFGGGLSAALAVGGAVSVLYGLAANLYWSQRMKDVYDPWRDPELDRWEEEQMR